MIKFRKFSLSDLPEVMEIEKASFPATKAYPKRRFEKYYKKYPIGFIVAEKKREIIGYIVGQIKKDSAEIVSLAIKPAWRRKGVGTAFINYLIDHFKKNGYREIFLRTRTKNKFVISFYQNIGFKIIKIIKNYYRNGDDAYLMKKNLGE